jgi:hypothetical protein
MYFINFIDRAIHTTKRLIVDNWVTVETNWEPLYTRGAVGEERSGVWGINTGGVWAAAPWGATTPSLTLHPTPLSPSKEPSVQVRCP